MINRRNVNIQWLAALSFIAICMNLQAQDYTALTEKYKEENALITQKNKELKIFFQNQQLVAESREETETLMLNEKAASLYSNHSIYHGSFDELKEIDAYTKVPDGSKYKKIKVTDFKTSHADSRSVFYDDSKETKFNFPSLTKGAIAYSSHTEFHKDIHFLTSFYIGSYAPIASSKFTVTYPSSVELKYIIRNNNAGLVNVEQTKKGKNTILTFTTIDVPVFKYFGDAPAYSYYAPHIIVYVSSYKNDDDNTINVFNNLQGYYNWCYGFIKNINTEESPLLKHLADSLTNSYTNPHHKAKAIYKWVQKNIKYVAFEDGLEGFIPRQAKDVCTKRYGDCKDMSSLITALCKAAGLKAYYTWIGTRDIPYDYEEVHLPITDNHMISVVNIGDEWIFLDGTDSYCSYGTAPAEIQNKQALVAIDENNYKILRVPIAAAKENAITDSTYISITNDGIKGNMMVYYSGYCGADVYGALAYKDLKDVRDYIKYRMSKASNKFIMGDYTINEIDKDKSSIAVGATFEVPGYSKKSGDEIYINLNLEKFHFDGHIDTAVRNIPVSKKYTYTYNCYTILQLPDGYEIDFLPPNSSINKDGYSFAINYTLSSNKIIAHQQLVNTSLWLMPKDFATWNSALKELNKQYKEQVVLRKKK